MAKIHDRFVIELQEVIKGYGNNPDVDDVFHVIPCSYKFYEMPGIAINEQWFKNMLPLEAVMKKEGKRYSEWSAKDKNGVEVKIGDRVVNDDGYHKVYGTITFGEYKDNKQNGGHYGVHIEWEDDGANTWSDWWRQDILYWLPNVERV